MIALYIILSIILLLLIILLIPVNLKIEYTDLLTLDLSYGFLKFRIYPEKKPDDIREQAEKTGEDKSNTFFKELIAQITEGESFVDKVISVCSFVKYIMSQAVKLFRRVTAEEFYLHITVGAQDAAETALAFGGICAAVYPARGMAEGIIKFRKSDVVIKPDYEAGENNAELRLRLRLIPIKAVGPLAAAGYKIYKAMHENLNKKDGAQK